MNDKTYNGWTNYATWRVHLELFYGIDPSDFSCTDNYELAQELKGMAEQAIDPEEKGGLAVDYAMAFLSDVNWYEIAEHVAPDEDEDADEEEAV